MKKEKDYLIAKLKESGIKSQVYTTMKKLKQANESHLGAVLRNGETLARSGSKKKLCRPRGATEAQGQAVEQGHKAPGDHRRCLGRKV